MEIEWSRAGFERLGFIGWKPFGELEKDDLPVDRGVYVVTTPPASRPTFLPESVGGKHKRRVLTAENSALEAAWRDGAEVLYVGKAGGALGLQDRLWAYAKQGRGRSAGHYGGRYLWQLPSSAELLVGWRGTGGIEAGVAEEALLALHKEAFGVRPFANLTGGGTFSPHAAREVVSQLIATAV